MEKKYECPQCFIFKTINQHGPFCSEICAINFTEYAPIKLIVDVYDKYSEWEKTETNEINDIQFMIVKCNWCNHALDLDFIDDQNEFFCSPQCADNLIEEEDILESNCDNVWINRC